MEKGTTMSRLVTASSVSVILIVYCAVLVYGSAVASDSSRKEAEYIYSEKIYIDGMKAFGRLERPGVTFRHDLHTGSTLEEKRNCSACHMTENGRQSMKFKRLNDSSRKEVMNIYHENCIGCHKEFSVKNRKSGPVTCGECHVMKAYKGGSVRPAGFDMPLHQLHSENHEGKCETCHHEYDNNLKKLVYIKGKEGSCRYCHKETDEQNIISMKGASHVSCIDCHLENIGNKKKTGPVECGGCHEPATDRKGKSQGETTSRIERGQPDFTIVSKETEAETDSRIESSVPFSHKAHEEYNGSCIACHHKGISACSDCHSKGDRKEGVLTGLGDAMHRPDSAYSCIGCHELKKKDRNCAGCHASMGVRSNNISSCDRCHINPDAGSMAATNSSDIMAVKADKEAVAGDNTEKKVKSGKKSGAESELSPELAERLLKSAGRVSETYPDSDIPEKIMIGKLSDRYESVEFPHRQIVKSLAGKIKDSRLAGYFHEGRDTICQGCHHNAPPDRRPPECVSCHAVKSNDSSPTRPALMGAYHNQCMGCHKEMGMDKPSSCTDCHREKTGSAK